MNRAHVRSGRPALTLAIANNDNREQVRVVHDGAPGHAQGVSELSALMDRAGNEGVDVAGESSSGAEGGDQPLEPSGIPWILGVELLKGTLKPGSGKSGGCPVTGADNEQCF